VTATFTQDEYTLTVNVVGDGSVDVDPHQTTYHYGDVVELTATANPGWSFDGWSGDLSGSDNPETITMNGDRTVTATFTKLPPELSLSKEDGGEAVEPGGTISYTLTYTNAGGDATGVVITETVPVSTSFNATASDPGWVCESDGSCTLDIGAVTHNGSGFVLFVVVVDDPLSEDVTEIGNTAEIGDDGSGGPDSNPANNTASVATTVKPAPAPAPGYIYLPLIFNS
jgi:uncharacterized repeat protein (TIGR01451 family)/uncharacterized repeat protein (TIGR02543 family)